MNADAAPVETEAAHEVLADSYQVATVAEFSHVARTRPLAPLGHRSVCWEAIV